MLAAVAWASQAGGVAQEPATRSVAERVYSPEQAERGQRLFRDVCIVCHPDPLWRESWQGQTVREVYSKILRFMPDDDPGSLSPAEAASAVAYILQSNGFPAGEVALSADESALNRIRIEAPPK